MEEIYVVKVRTKPDAARLYPSERRYSALTVGGLGAVHLVLGATSLLLGVLGLVLHEDDSWTTRYGGGLWLGVFALMAGAAGMLAWRRWYVDNNIRWFFASCTISAAASLVCLIVTAAALAAIQEQRNSHNFIYYNRDHVMHLPDDSHPVPPPASMNLLQHSGQQTSSPNGSPIAEYLQQEQDENKLLPSHLPLQTDRGYMDVLKEQLTTNRPSSHIMHIVNTKDDHAVLSEHSHSLTRQKKSAQSETDVTPQEDELNGDSEDSSTQQPIVLETDTSFQQRDADMTLHTGEDEDAYVVKERQNIEDISPDFHRAPSGSASREVRTVIAINILVASALELAWSLLSASIAWKGMRSSYNESATNGDVDTEGTRTVEGVERSPPPAPPPSSDAYSKQGGEKPSMEEYFRKPDIISNHHRRHFSSKVASKNERNNRQVINTVSERIDHFLPLEESTMEYQERVHRFLASNNLAAPSDTASNIDST